jgi:hypothetical protein
MVDKHEIAFAERDQVRLIEREAGKLQLGFDGGCLDR